MSAFIDAGEKKGTKRKADKAVTTKDPTTPKKPAEGARGSQFHTQNSAAFSADANGQPATAATQPAPDKRRHPGKDEKKAQQKEHETKEAEHGQDKQTYASLPSTDKEETEKLGSPPSPPAMDIKEKRKYTREEWDEWNAHKQAKDSGHTHQDRSDWQRKGKMTDTEDPDQDEEFRSRQPPPAAQAHVCDSFAAPSPAILPPAMPPSAPAARPIKVILPLEIAKYAKRREKERLEKLENSRKDLEHYKGKARRERDRRKDLETDVEHYKRKGKRLEEDVEHYTKQARRERDRRRDLEKDVEHYKRKARRERRGLLFCFVDPCRLLVFLCRCINSDNDCRYPCCYVCFYHHCDCCVLLLPLRLLLRLRLLLPATCVLLPACCYMLYWRGRPQLMPWAGDVCFKLALLW